MSLDPAAGFGLGDFDMILDDFHGSSPFLVHLIRGPVARGSSARIGERNARGSVSRVLSIPLRGLGDHSSRRTVTRTLKQSTRTAGPEPTLDKSVPSLFDLAPGGVCHAASVTVRAVRSYRTLSPFAGPKPLAVFSLWHFP
ncbi:sedoheptulokinase [Sphingopyxis macrogoltabida]|nr:sedoheptulokinase [Sphingopyxis macrogoltabida]